MYRIPAIRFICEAAKKRAKKLGALNGSIRKGEGNYVVEAVSVKDGSFWGKWVVTVNKAGILTRW